MRMKLPIALVAAVSATALLAGCDQRPAGSQVIPPPTGAPIASMGLDEGAPPPPVYAPAADRIGPARRPIRVTALGPDPDRYLYVDDAYDMIDAFGDSPPDYAFDYEGSEPWVWRSDAGYYRVVEVIPGGLREYYYGPRDDEPFLVRDPRYAYAYDDGVLVAVYDPYGRALAPDIVYRQADYASRYYDRAQVLHYAALHQARRPAYAAQWRARQDDLDQGRQRWAVQRDRDDEWRRLRDRRGEVQQTAWVKERRQREDYTARLAVAQQSHAKAFGQARRDDVRADQIRVRDEQRARAEAERPQAFAREDDRRQDALRRQAEAQLPALGDRRAEHDRNQAQVRQQQALVQQQRFAEQGARRAERQRGEDGRLQAQQAQARAAEQHAAQAATREQAQQRVERKQQEGQQRAELRRVQAEHAQGQQRRAMEQQAQQQRQAEAQQRQAQQQHAQSQQRQAEAQQRQTQMAERQRGQQAQAQQRQAEAQQRQAQQQHAQAQQRQAEAANAQRQARDASAHEHAAQAAAKAQHGNGKDKHDRPQ